MRSRLLRSTLRVAAVLAISVLFAAPSPASAAPPPDSPAGFLGGPDRRGVLPGRVPRRRPRELWRTKTEGPIRSTPLWAGDRVFFGSADGHLHALDARSGKTLWKVKTGGAVDGSPTLAHGLVVVASRDRVLRAHDPATGKERWRFAFGPDLPFKWGWDFFLSSASVSGDLLSIGGGDGVVYGLDAKTGRERWRFATKGRVRATPSIAGGVVYVGSFDGRVYGLDEKTGKEVWRFDTEGRTFDLAKWGFDRLSVQSSAIVAGDAIVVGSRDGHFYGAERSSGKQRFSLTHKGSWVVGSPAVHDGVAYVGTSDGHFVQAVEVASGKELWRTTTPQNVLTSAVLVSGTLLLGGMDGALMALDAATGRELWRYRTPETILASPVVKDGVILVASSDGTLAALGGDLDAPPITASRAVYAADPSAPWRWVKRDRAVFDALVDAGYEGLDDQGLVKLLEARAVDGKPSVVVLASGSVPPEVEGDGTEKALVRRYLDAGGKIVWLGGPPFATVLDPATKQPKAVDGKRPRAILGVDLSNQWWGDERITATPLGEKMGLSGWWVSDMGYEREDVMEPLALDQDGRVSAFRLRYGGGEGTGFVYLSGRERIPPALDLVLAVAEHGLP